MHSLFGIYYILYQLFSYGAPIHFGLTSVGIS